MAFLIVSKNDQSCPEIIFMTLEGLSGQWGVVCLWWNFSLDFLCDQSRKFDFGGLYQNVLPGNTHKYLVRKRPFLWVVLGFRSKCSAQFQFAVQDPESNFEKDEKMWCWMWHLCTCLECQKSFPGQCDKVYMWRWTLQHLDHTIGQGNVGLQSVV